MEDNAIAAVVAGQPLDLVAVRRQIVAVCLAIEGVLTGRTTLNEFYTEIGRLNAVTALPSAGDSRFTLAMLDGARTTRGAVSRIVLIRDTSFIQTGYVLLNLLIGTSILVLTVAHFKSDVAQYLIVGFVTLTYVYLLRLIHDLDNPFEYRDDGKARGSTEVDYGTLRGFRRYIQGLLPAEPAAPSAGDPLA